MVNSTGSGVLGLQVGMQEALKVIPGNTAGAPTIIYVNGDPNTNNIVSTGMSSGLAIDWANEKIYLCEYAAGSEWINIGSTQ